MWHSSYFVKTFKMRSLNGGLTFNKPPNHPFWVGGKFLILPKDYRFQSHKWSPKDICLLFSLQNGGPYKLSHMTSASAQALLGKNVPMGSITKVAKHLVAQAYVTYLRTAYRSAHLDWFIVKMLLSSDFIL